MKLNFAHSGSGSPVLAIHGLFGSLSNLGGLAKALSDDYSVYAIDLRNHGESPHSNELGYSSLAADLVELMDDHDIAQAALVGHSMGGKAAMQLALSRPERVGALVIGDIAPVRYPSHHEATIAGLNAVVESRPKARREADVTLAEFVSEPAARAFLLKNLVKTDADTFALRVNLRAIETHYDEIAAPPHGTPFPGPTLFMKGGNSDYILAAYRDTILNLFPNAELKVLENTAHWLHADKPALFNRTVLRFLGNLSW